MCVSSLVALARQQPLQTDLGQYARSWIPVVLPGYPTTFPNNPINTFLSLALNPPASRCS